MFRSLSGSSPLLSACCRASSSSAALLFLFARCSSGFADVSLATSAVLLSVLACVRSACRLAIRAFKSILLSFYFGQVNPEMNRSRSPERQDRRNIADSRDAGREDSRRDRDGRGAPAGRDWDQRRDRDVGRDSGRSARDSGRDSRDSGRDSGRDARDSGRDAGRDARDSGRDPRDAGRDSGRDARDGREERSFRDSRDQIPREAREQNPRDLREQQKDSRDQRNPGSMTMDTGRGQEGSTANESEKSADTVYISGLPHTVTEESLTKFFATVGIIKVRIF